MPPRGVEEDLKNWVGPIPTSPPSGPPQLRHGAGFFGPEWFNTDLPDPMAPRGVDELAMGGVPSELSVIEPHIIEQHEKEKERGKADADRGLNRDHLLFAGLAAGLGALAGGSMTRGLIAGVHGLKGVAEGQLLLEKRQAAKKEKSSKKMMENIERLWELNPQKAAAVEQQWWKIQHNMDIPVAELMDQNSRGKWEDRSKEVKAQLATLAANTDTAAGVEAWSNYYTENWQWIRRDEFGNEQLAPTEDEWKTHLADVATKVGRIEDGEAHTKNLREKLKQDLAAATGKRQKEGLALALSKAQHPGQVYEATVGFVQKEIRDGLKTRAASPEGRREIEKYLKTLDGPALPLIPVTPAQPDTIDDVTGKIVQAQPDTTAQPAVDPVTGKTGPAVHEAAKRWVSGAFGSQRGRQPDVYPDEWILDIYDDMLKNNPDLFKAGDKTISITEVFPGQGNPVISAYGDLQDMVAAQLEFLTSSSSRIDPRLTHPTEAQILEMLLEAEAIKLDATVAKAYKRLLKVYQDK